jgi:hypothetical protein
MNEKTIDVLDIMRRDAVAASELLTAAEFRESSEARDAVRELIEADKAYDAALRSGSCIARADATLRRREAIARVGGEA